MYTLVIDGNSANVAEPVGVSIYTQRIIEWLHKNPQPNTQIEIYLKRPPLPHLPLPTAYLRYKVIWGPVFWLKWWVSIQLFINKPTWYFAPAHYAPAFIPKHTKLIVTIHDLAYKYFPNEFKKEDLYKLDAWTLSAIQKATRIIAVSEHTKKDILKYFPNILSDHVFVISNGFDPAITTQVSHTKYTKAPYFLSISTIQPRKNYERLIDAFCILHKKYPAYELHIVGKMGWMYETIMNKIHTTPGVIYHGSVSEAKKHALLYHAYAFVLPSLYEGFGIPLLEAMSYKLPVITSNTSAVPEVVGDAGILCDPLNTQAIAHAMEKIVTNLKLCELLRIKSTKRIQSFSWESCARKTYDIITHA